MCFELLRCVIPRTNICYSILKSLTFSNCLVIFCNSLVLYMYFKRELCWCSLMLLFIDIFLQGAMEWPSCYHIAGDNNPQAVKRAANNICSLLKKNENKERWEEHEWFSFPVLFVSKSILHWFPWPYFCIYSLASITDVTLKMFSVNHVWDECLCTCSSTSLGIPLDIIQWDICNLPLRTGSVDVIVTDMPFGKRWGVVAELTVCNCHAGMCLCVQS